MTRRILLLVSAVALTNVSCPKPRDPTATPPRQRAEPAPDRLRGEWELRSVLHVKQGLAGAQERLLALSKMLRAVLNGELPLDGLPALARPLVQRLLKGAIRRAVPPWAFELADLLADLHTALGEIRVESVETLQPAGPYRYKGRSVWKKVFLRYRGRWLRVRGQSAGPLGRLTVSTYNAREQSGVLHLEKHRVEQAQGRFVRWALEAGITTLSCAIPKIPCFKGLDELLGRLLDCNRLADRLAGSSFSLRLLKGTMIRMCQRHKTRLLGQIKSELDRLSVSTTFVDLTGRADIAGDRLTSGRWLGRAGSAYGQGRFTGTFTGMRRGAP